MENLKPARSDDNDEIPALTIARIEAEARRARKARAQDGKIIRRLIEQLGVSQKARGAGADADFGEAMAQAAQWLRQLRRSRSRSELAVLR